MLLIASLHPAATIARIDGRWPSLLPSCSKTGGVNERLGAGAYHGSRRRLRHSISAFGPKIPSTKAVKGRSLSPAHNTSSVKGGYHVPFRHNFNRRHYRHGTC